MLDAAGRPCGAAADRAGVRSRRAVALAVALAVRALRGGSVCVDLRSVSSRSTSTALPWPDAARGSARCGQPAGRPSRRCCGSTAICSTWTATGARSSRSATTCSTTGRRHRPTQASARHRPAVPAGFDEQRAAAEVALSHGLTVLTGGPGTGKTTTVARLLALLREQAGDAAAADRAGGADGQGGGPAAGGGAARGRASSTPADRERLAGLHASTLHRLLGSRPDTSARFRHHRGNRLPHDVIVVDETSMVSLTMMARLLEAVRRMPG